ncbi:helicase-exonuclease AddAB subunit AddB [Aneurinibacillus tyrosinisolvens]|uniref:helicase-exonuclease AddAB subunit AddB n=1 Tax=Aneurinibacillus tyrosinisolvens TaxID=1443435 RepID=UPI00063F1D78|nr:helicase-exonuclease AddAB subunit AddB [Aneurinibacillus tyrosinisolvens]
MGLRWILGRAGSGKSYFCLDEIRSRLKENPIGSPLIYLVPQQMSFQSEYALAAAPGLGGTMRAQVLSFNRLAWKVLSETGGLSRVHIDSTGIKMLLQKIIDKHRTDFRIFARAAGKKGFIDQLEQMYCEMARYGIVPEDLLGQQMQAARKTEGEQSARFLSDKLHDMHLIYTELEQRLTGRYLDAEHYLPLLNERIALSQYISEADVWIDGFDGFTPQELAVISSLLNQAKSVSVALTLDKPYEDDIPDELDLFYPTALTYRRINELAEKQNIHTDSPILLGVPNKTPVRFAHSPAIAHLEGSFRESRHTSFPDEPQTVRLSAAAHRRAEVEGVARHILSLVRDEGYRWRDVAIIVRNMESYEDIFTTIFTDYNLPFFLDQKRLMVHHPLVEFIRSSLEVARFNWRYDAVFRCAKTDLLLPLIEGTDRNELREQLDRLENYVLSHGIEGYRWMDKQPWRYQIYRGLDDEAADSPRTQTEEEKQIEEQLNTLRHRITAPLIELQTFLQNAGNVRMMCEGLYAFLLALEVPEQLERWSEESIASGQLGKAREHDQVWQALIDMLDQFVEVMGEEQMSFDEFASVLDAGMENLRFSLVPPALDQVLVGSVDKTRFANVKCSFILGINDGVFPARIQDDSILSESERSFLAVNGMELAPGSQRKLLDEQFMIYRAFTSASDLVLLSYPLADEEGKALLPSGLVKRIKEWFPQLRESFIPVEAADIEGDEQLSFISSPERTLSYLTSQLQHWRKGYPLPSLWWHAYNWFTVNMPEPLTRATHSLFYRNEEAPLRRGTSQALYGKHLKASVSRMEKFQACPYAQFASYGLRLKERELYRLEAPDIGQLFHGTLKLIGEHIQQEKLSWAELESEALRTLASEKVDVLTPLLQREILLSSNRHHYLTHKLKNVVGRAAQVLGEHARRSQFEPKELELAFGANGKLPALTFTLPNGCTMELVGRIDRVDGAVGEQGLLLRVIDYKSSQTSLQLTDVYFGLSLQMLTYLDVLISHAKAVFGEKALPAGVLYFHVHNPMLQNSSPMSGEAIQRELGKHFKMKGLVVADREIVRLMDTELDTGHSDILPVSIKKDGTFYSNAAVATAEQFEMLRRYTRRVIREIGMNITDGMVAISPYRKKKKTACTFCSYRSVCQFDPLIETNEFRILREEPKEKIWQDVARHIEEGGILDENDR